MRKTLLFLFLSCVMSVFAQYPADGYYRVQNATTGRYIVVIDNRGSINVSSTSADLNALRTYEGFEKVVSNPASVIYAKKHGSSSNEYNLFSQGTDIYSIVTAYLKLYNNNDGTYKAYASRNGLAEYLYDDLDGDSIGFLLTGKKTAPNNDWKINPIDNSDESFYFGVKPKYTVDDYSYAAFYAAFPFSFYSEGMTAYYVDKIGTADDGFGMAVWKEITNEMKPAATPMMVKCSSTEPINNKLNLIYSSSTPVSDNLLAGTYFCNDVLTTKHRNVIDYDPSTMRLLGVTSSGSIGFVTATVEDVPYVPANEAYLIVPEGTASELQLVSDEEYDELMEEHAVDGIEEISVATKNMKAKTGVYTLTGLKVSDGNSLPVGAAAGIYIVGGNKVVVR